MKNIQLFRGLLILQTTLLIVYSVIAISNEGPNFFAIALSNVERLTWNGQFNLDFSCYLILSGLWLMWRNQFSTVAVMMGILVSILGIIAFAPYLLYLISTEKGDLKKVLIGER